MLRCGSGFRVWLAWFVPVLLSGCALSPTAAPTPDPGVRLQGTVHGGEQPIVGSQIYLLAANTTGYGGPGIAASPVNASLSLLQPSANTTLDQSGTATNGFYYVTSDTNGNFTITGDYACTTGQQVYLYALGGNAGSGANSAAGLLAALGSCPATGNFISATPFIFVNEVSTVAAAYAFAGFASDALHVSSSRTALAQAGIANAFANAGNLATLSTGTALTTTPAGNGTVPQTVINSVADALAACTNSTGPGSEACSLLLENTLSGGTTGSTPTDTATAAIYTAHYPAANVNVISGLSSAVTPFQPELTYEPWDFSIAITYTGAGPATPGAIAIDAAGDAWVANLYLNSVTEFSPLGAVLSGANGFTGGGLNSPESVAIDQSGNVWVSNFSGGATTELSSAGVPVVANGYTGAGQSDTVGEAFDGLGDLWAANEDSGLTELSSAGANLSPSTGYLGGGLSGSVGVAVDGSGNAWVTNLGNNVLSVFSNSGVAVTASSGYAAGGLNTPFGIAMDANGNAWIANEGTGSVTEVSNLGVVLSPSGGYTGAGLDYPVSVAIDGAGNAWVANLVGSVTELSSAGAAISPYPGYTGGGVLIPNEPADAVIDGSGDVWVAGVANGSVMEMIGAATPVITPIAAGLPVTPTANGTSLLGTEP